MQARSPGTKDSVFYLHEGETSCNDQLTKDGRHQTPKNER
jgi:hypothetical protein